MSIGAGTVRFVRWMQGERRAARKGGRRATDHEPNRGWVVVLAIAIPIALLDWGTKWAVVQAIPLHEFVLVVPDKVAFWHVKNPALVLGLHGDLPIALRKALVSAYALLSFVFLVAVMSRGHRLLPHRRKWAWLFLGMVVGGMLGNLGERALHWGVTDYLSFRWGNFWLPPGNVADLSILLALPVSLAVLYFELEARALRRPVSAGAADEAPRLEPPAMEV